MKSEGDGISPVKPACMVFSDDERFLQISVENLAAMQPDVLSTVYTKDSAFTAGRIIYTQYVS